MLEHSRSRERQPSLREIDTMSKGTTPSNEAQEYCLIPLMGICGAGFFAKVSPHRFLYLSQFRWNLSHGYAVRSRSKRYKHRSMHREITNCPDHMVVDHIDGDTLNNTDINLRIVTWEQNAKNVRKKSAQASSSFMGVYYNKRNRKWVARIYHNGK